MNLTIDMKTCQHNKSSSDNALRDSLRRQIRLEIEYCDSKQEACAYEMGIDTSLISHYANGTREFPLWRLISWTRTYGSGLLRWIANRCGYDLVPIGESMFTGVDIKTLIQAFVERSASLVSQSMQDRMSLDGWKGLQRLVNRIVEVLEHKETDGGQQ